MDKILLIIKREYLTRVKKKSFVIMTIIGPILMACLVIVPAWLSKVEESSQIIQVVDETTVLGAKIQNTEKLTFVNSLLKIEEAKKQFYQTDASAILYIPYNALNNPAGIMIFYKKQPGMTVIKYMEKAIEQEIETAKLAASGVDKKMLETIKTNVRINTINIPESGIEEESDTELSMVIGLLAGIMIYFFIFLYGVQVMRGVIEEKTNRIVEIIISSVKPFQLMMGKIIGIALVGLTQFLLWIVLTFSIISIVQTQLLGDKFKVENIKQTAVVQEQMGMQQEAMQSEKAGEIFEAIGKINFPLMIAAFIFYFLGGYLLYSALFAAVGAAVDSEADTQQFVMPITLPLILSFVMVQFVINNPEGPVAFWFSIIPLTSPIMMMVRIPFGVPAWEVYLSMALLVVGFLTATWLAGKIYRIGILMYGKKPSYRELLKWLFYKG